ncbi:hypothetical protein [Streptomyces sp. NPDC002790]|uniref:hypothetical protein n=1 Tax=Streptomyces sp. NPDC002790 TaxID=3154431 RepID=UPI003332A9F7
MHRKALRTCTTAAAAAGCALTFCASPAHTSVIWDGDASQGTGVFTNTLCDSPDSVTTGN